MNKKIVIKYDSDNPFENVYDVLDRVRAAYLNQNRMLEFREIYDRIENCNTYKEGLGILGEYATLKDISKRKTEMQTRRNS